MVSKPLPFLVYCFSSSISFIQPFESGMTRSYHFYNHIYIYMYVYGEIIPLYGSKNAGVLSMPLRFPPHSSFHDERWYILPISYNGN